jgi:hypothetical protein
MNLNRNGRSLTPAWRGSSKTSPRRLALIPQTLVSFATGFFATAVIWLPSTPFTQHETVSAIAFGGYDGGAISSQRPVPGGVNPDVTVSPDSLVDTRAVLGTAAMTARSGAPPFSPSRVFPTLSLQHDENESQLSVRGLMKAVSAGALGRGIFGVPAMFRREASRTMINEDLWSNFYGIAWGLPNEWHPATFREKIRRDVGVLNMSCPGPSCPDLATAAGQTTQGESPETEDPPSVESSEPPASGKTVRRASAEERWIEVTYDPSPPSVASPVLSLFCDSHLPATPSSFLLACDTVRAGTGSWGLSFQYDALGGELYSDSWNLSVDIGSGFQVVVASELPNLLDQFGVNQIRNTNTQARQGLQAIGKSASLEVLKDAIAPTTGFFAGITSQGPASAYLLGITSQGLAGGYEITSGQFGAQVTAIAAAGQVQIAGSLIFQTGDLGFGYSWSTDGGALIGRFKRDPFDLTIALASSDVQVGLSYAPENGPTVQASWSGSKGFEIAIAASFKLSLGEGGHGPILEPFDSGSSMELPLGPANLVLSPPSPSDGPSSPSIDFKWPLPGPAQPVKPSTPSPGAGATLVVRTCVVAEGVDTCRPEDAILPLKILVDGTSMTLKVGEIPVSPGRHLVVVPAEAVPQGLTPLRGLNCDLTIPASTVGTCELPFRR